MSGLTHRQQVIHLETNKPMYVRIVRHYEKDFPVEGVYAGYYDGNPAIFAIENSTVEIAHIMSIKDGCQFLYETDKNKIEIILR